MKLLAVGGGSGGHVTPVVAIVNELATIDPSLETLFVCDTTFETQTRGLMAQAAAPVEVAVVSAGKFRRYAHLPMWRQLLMPSIVFPNLRDLGRMFKGIFQSLRLIRRFEPDVVFAKGGFVCLPVGIAAKIKKIPLVIHDSDSRPGLTNKILARWATTIATGYPVENYSYRKDRTYYTGVPVGREFVPFNIDQQQQAKQLLGVSPGQPLVVVTGGGLGAARINEAVAKEYERIITAGANIYHITGIAHFSDSTKKGTDGVGYKAVPFVYDNMPQVLGAADIVIARGSATFLQELAGLGKATIIIPARQLSDQQKNAQLYKRADAAIVLSDDEIAISGSLSVAVIELLDSPGRRLQLAEHIHKFSRPDAARDVAQLIHQAVAR